MAHVMIELPQETLNVLHELANVVQQDPQEKDPLAILLRRSLRTYEWVVYQQSQDRQIIAVSQEELQYLQDGGFTEEEDDRVEREFSEEKKDRVRAYFENANAA